MLAPADGRPGRFVAGEKKERLDVVLAARGLAETRSVAQRLILAGRVRVDGQEVIQPGRLVTPEHTVEVTEPPRYVSRGGEKLEAALDRFGVDPQGWTCADTGSSTGGFTDCLLQRGAARVYAIDVGKGILDWKLRSDPRIVVMEKTNARFVSALPEPIALATLDVSFISLRLLFPVVRGWLAPRGQVVALIKPQFEAGRGQVGKGGVVRDPAVHRRVLSEVLAAAEGAGFAAAGLIDSPLKGPAGNIEFLAHLLLGASTVAAIERLVEDALAEPVRQARNTAPSA
jgi:23S rRNA (cytidine1920-2'-O)/16S rRNA (cytidine1409-2'-O)-methyltransferase